MSTTLRRLARPPARVIKLDARFMKCDARLDWSRYSNNRFALVLTNAAKPPGHDDYLIATVNLPEVVLPGGCTFIKNWGENEGVLDSLVNAGIVCDTGRTAHAGLRLANVCGWLLNPENEISE